MFASSCRNGIPEDPVNGSSHTLLSPYWATVLGQPAEGRTSLRARQCSPRGGDLELVADFHSGRVELAGPAAVAIEGTMLVPV